MGQLMSNPRFTTATLMQTQNADDVAITGGAIVGAIITSPAVVANTVAIAGATLGTNVLAATGNANISGNVTIGGTLTYGGVTLSSSVTGTGAMVAANTPTLITPVLGAATGTSLSVTGAVTGQAGLIVGTNAASGATLTINAAAGTDRNAGYYTAGVTRWFARCDSTAEGGANAGSNYVLRAFTDAGAAIGNAMSLTRSSMAASFGATVSAASWVKTGSFTAGTLPAAATAGAGARAFVTDANATTFASVVAGGGANGVPVYSDGTNWRIG